MSVTLPNAPRDRTRPDPACEYCLGDGHDLGHTLACRESTCALAGGIDDCDGELFVCGCWDGVTEEVA